MMTATVVTATAMTAQQPIQDTHGVFSFEVNVSGPRLRTPLQVLGDFLELADQVVRRP